MTNSKCVDDKSSVVQDILVNDDLEKQKTNAKNKLNTQSTTTNKQDSKKVVGKSSQVKPKLIVVDVSKQRITRNKSKTLNKTQCLNRSSEKCDDKRKSGSITDYFSNLDLTNVDEKPDKTKIRCDKITSSNLKNKSSSIEDSKKCAVPKKSDSGNHKLTEYFPIRRSDRKYKREIDYERQKDLEQKVINETEDGLKIKDFGEKGRGIVVTKEFKRGDFVIEYIGDLIDRATAQKRELQYAKNKNVGCYMYYFKHKDQSYCIDATAESGKMGRLINHSRKGNLISRIVEVKQIPHLVLFAKADIPIDTELLYDYGDRNQESIKNHPWLTL